MISLPTLCGEKINSAKYLIAIVIDIIIPLRLLLWKNNGFR